jgi:hypothetical protein
MNFLTHIRSKPNDVKTRYTFAIAGIVTGLIAIVWATTLPARIAEINSKNTAPNEAPKTDSVVDFLSETNDQLGSVADSQNTENTGAERGDAVMTSSLGALRMDTATQTVSSTSVQGNNHIASTTVTQVQQNPPPQTTEVNPTTTPSERRVILIGTTTSQKTN